MNSETYRKNALALYAAREKWRLTRGNLLQYRIEVGKCDGHNHEEGPCYYQHRLAFPDWCDVCQGAQPLWLAYQVASRQAGVALQNLLRLCRREVAATRKPSTTITVEGEA